MTLHDIRVKKDTSHYVSRVFACILAFCVAMNGSGYHQIMRIDPLRVRQLRLIRALSQEGTLRKAAAVLHVSQPAAGAMLDAAEDALGVRLFFRMRNGVQPTDQGKALLQKIESLLQQLDNLGEDARHASARSGAILRVGVAPHVFTWLIPSATKVSNESRPTLKISDGSPTDLFDMLLAGYIDALIGQVPSEKLSPEITQAIEITPLYFEELAFTCATGHEFSTRAVVCLAELGSCFWVLPRLGSNTRTMFTEIFLRAGIVPPDPIIETNSSIYNLDVVAATDFLTIAPKTALLHPSRRAHLHIVNTDSQLATGMQVSFIALKSAIHQPDLATFKSNLSSAVQSWSSE